MASLVAVTGAAGFLGLHLVRGFDARGARVLPLVRAIDDRSPFGARSLADVITEPRFLAGVDVVVHAAAARSPDRTDPASLRAADVDLLESVMRASRMAGVRRFVLISSAEVYGFPARLPVKEPHPFAPRTLRSATKVEAEMRARRAARELRMDLVIARPSLVYGPCHRDGIIDAMASLLRAGVYRVIGSGDNIMHHAHIDDIVDGLWLATTREEAAGEDFIFAGPETTTLSELSARVARAVGRSLPRKHVPVGVARAIATVVDVAAHRGVALAGREPVLNHQKLDAMTLPLSFDIEKARRLLGFSPTVGYEEGVMRTIRGEWPALARAGAAP